MHQASEADSGAPLWISFPLLGHLPPRMPSQMPLAPPSPLHLLPTAAPTLYLARQARLLSLEPPSLEWVPRPCWAVCCPSGEPSGLQQLPCCPRLRRRANLFPFCVSVTGHLHALLHQLQIQQAWQSSTSPCLRTDSHSLTC